VPFITKTVSPGNILLVAALIVYKAFPGDLP
jgi:hypothetical protein